MNTVFIVYVLVLSLSGTGIDNERIIAVYKNPTHCDAAGKNEESQHVNVTYKCLPRPLR